MKHLHRLYAALCLVLVGAYAWAEYQGQKVTVPSLLGGNSGSSYHSGVNHK